MMNKELNQQLSIPYVKHKDFDIIKTVRSEHRQMVRKLHTPANMPLKQSCSYCGSGHPPKQCPVYGKNDAEWGKKNHFREVCRSKRGNVVHNVEQEPNLNQEEVKIDMVIINSISFNSKCSVITANLKIISNQATITVPYKVDTGSDGNIYALTHIQKMFPRAPKEQLPAMRNTDVNLKTCNRKTTITQ